MVKATVNFDDELYRKLIKETVEKYGKMRGFSKLVNEKVRRSEMIEIEKPVREIKDEEIKKRRSIVEKSFGIWKMKGTGAEYIRKLRDESEERRKRLGL